MAQQSESVILQIKYASEQPNGGILRIVGFTRVKDLVGLIDLLDLDANPRESKVGTVTKAIQESLVDTPDLFPFKTKGILLGASDFERLNLKRNRYRVTFNRLDREGVLDGGHNMLAIGIYILEQACSAYGVKHARIATWRDFKAEWNDKRELINDFCESSRKASDGSGGSNALDILVPVELLVPDSDEDVDAYRESLLDICDARNNNAQLTDSTKANKRGYFDDLRGVLEKKRPDLAERVEWKTNDGGDIKVVDLVALTWIPLRPVLEKIGPLEDDQGKPVEAPSPVNFYSGKATGLKKFERLMSSPSITTKPTGDYHRELRSTVVLQAFEIAADIPELYDYIYSKFPELYNAAGGKYGRISAVKSVNLAGSWTGTTPFGNEKVETNSPLGYITPLVYGLQALVEVVEADGYMNVHWKVKNPREWLEEKLPGIVRRYAKILKPWDFDPQKVGKDNGSYEAALEYFTMAYANLD